MIMLMMTMMMMKTIMIMVVMMMIMLGFFHSVCLSQLSAFRPDEGGGGGGDKFSLPTVATCRQPVAGP